MTHLHTVTTFVVAIVLLGCGYDGRSARQEAEDFARNTLGFQNPTVTCQDYDSNEDGYVSCTVVDPVSMEREAIECSGLFSWNSGCRLATGAGGRSHRQQ